MSAAEPAARGASSRIDRFLAILPARNGSDLHLAVGSPPILRLDGELERSRYRDISEADYENLVRPITPARLWESFVATGDVERRRVVFAEEHLLASTPAVGGAPVGTSRRHRCV